MFRKYAFKILLNSCYGKLVESIERTSIIFGKDNVNKALKLYGAEAVFGTNTAGVYKMVTEEQGPFRHVAAGAYVTARSRILLHRFMKRCEKMGGKIYYCDTDSLVTDIKLPFIGTKLGDLELESTWVEGEFIVPKVYRFTTTEGETFYKCKGMPFKGLSKLQEKQRWDAYTRQVYESDFVEDDTMFLRKEGLRGFLSNIAKGNIVPEKEILTRRLRNLDTKRVHTGEESRPLTMDVAV
jgi:hypothetical protein